MNERIKKIRKDSGLNQTEFGETIGASRPMITSYELGKVIPDASKQMLICERFNVNPDWLSTGEGQPYKTGLVPRLAAVLRSSPALAAALESVMDRLTLDDWRALNDIVAKAIAQGTQKEE